MCLLNTLLFQLCHNLVYVKRVDGGRWRHGAAHTVCIVFVWCARAALSFFVNTPHTSHQSQPKKGTISAQRQILYEYEYEMCPQHVELLREPGPNFSKTVEPKQVSD